MGIPMIPRNHHGWRTRFDGHDHQFVRYQTAMDAEYVIKIIPVADQHQVSTPGLVSAIKPPYLEAWRPARYAARRPVVTGEQS